MSMKHRIGAAGVCVVLATLVAGNLEATTLQRMDLPEIVETADRVVHARVLDRRSYWDEARTQIFTDTDFEVLDQAKGDGPRFLTITLLGGTVGIIDMIVPGTPVFDIDEEVVLFTEPRPDGRKHLVGLSQGVMRIVHDPASGEPVAVSGVHGGVSYLEPVEGTLRTVRARSQRVPLRHLMDGVRAMVQGNREAHPLFSDTPESPVKRPGGRNRR